MTIDELVNKYYDNLNDSDLYIWNYIEAHKKEVSDSTIEELTKHCNVSKTSVIRFAKKLSLTGFSELKVYLKLESSVDTITKEKENILDELCSGYNEAVENLRSMNMDPACEIIKNANRVFIYGSGSVQLNAAREMYRYHFNSGEFFHVFDSKDDVDDIMFNLREGDVVIIISLRGESQQAVNLAKNVRMKGVKVISITQFKNNTLATLSDESIYYSVYNLHLPGDHGRTIGTTSLLFILIEMFYIKYMVYVAKTEKK